MPEYQFKAIDANGNITKGAMTAESAEALTETLAGRNLFLMESRIVEIPVPVADKPVEKAEAASVRVARPGDSVKLKEVTIFTTQLTVMVRSALPIIESLDMLTQQTKNPVFKNILEEISGSVRQGQPLSQAFGRYPKVFDEVYISLLASGEASGKLDVMLERLAEHLEFQMELKQKVRAALVYPTIVIMTAVLVVVFLILFVLPTFMEVFTQFNIALPLPTRILIFVSEQLRRWWYLILLAVGGGWWYLSEWLLDPLHIRLIHNAQIRLPILGDLVRNIVMTRILRTLGSLTESGVPIIKSLELAKNSAGNVVFGEIIDNIIRNVKEGRGIAPAFAESPFIPASVVGMINTGEKTGTLPEVVNKVADYYESETDSAIRNLFSVLEPLFILFLAFLVGGIAVSVLLPMFELARGIQ
ncbi:MAG: type II secretion system F family protein [Elusimicrobiaceae bacterium]